MNKLTKHTLQGTAFIAALLFILPVHSAAATSTISIVDLRTINTTTFTFPGGGAFSFRPGIVSVDQGGKVVFTDNGYDMHTVTSYTNKVPFNLEGLTVQLPIPDGKFDSGIHTPILSGQSWTLDTTNLASGDYTYFCQIHPWMQATLRVTSSSSHTIANVNIDHHQGDTSQFFSGSASWGFLPPDLTVSQGTTVPVTNTGHIFHTFSSYSQLVPFQEGFKTLHFPISNGVFNQTLAPGQTYNLNTGQLTKGTYNYACLFHPWMLGSIIVS